MKRIEFIAPVEAIRGNLSGNQDLRYAENNNKAFEAPEGRVNYARNYTPRYIGAKRAKDGHKYFSVRTKNGVNLTPYALQAMALLGGAGALQQAILADAARRRAIEGQITFLVQRGLLPAETTIRQYMFPVIREALQGSLQNVVFQAGTGTTPVTVTNPWFAGYRTDVPTLKLDVFAKFWPQLVPGGFNFYVNGQKGIAVAKPDAPNFLEIVENDTTNILGLTPHEELIMLGNNYLRDPNGNYVRERDEVIKNGRYTTTSIAPTA